VRRGASLILGVLALVTGLALTGNAPNWA